MNQEQVILNHLLKHKTITSMEAIETYGFTRLSAVIFNLRKSGVKIGMVWEQGTNRFGNPIKWGKYFLIKNK